MHELFHRIQGGLGLSSEMPKMPPGSGENAHLDSLEGRYWMRLEWRGRALARALGASGAARGVGTWGAHLTVSGCGKVRSDRLALKPY